MTEFVSVDEATVTRAIVEEYMKDFLELTEVDAVVVGMGPAGTIAAKELAEKGWKVLVIERNIKPGGGMLLGGMLMNKLVVERPAEKFLIDAGVKTLKEYRPGLFVCDAGEASAKLIAQAFDAGAKMLNAVEVTDVIYKKDEVKGVVINWHMVRFYPDWVTCTDPLCVKAKVVIDCTGHAAEIARVAAKKNKGYDFLKTTESSLWMDEAEKQVVENTSEIIPGIIVAGMAVAGTYGTPRMGPIFGAMFMSGKKAADIAHQKLLAMSKKETAKQVAKY